MNTILRSLSGSRGLAAGMVVLALISLGMLTPAARGAKTVSPMSGTVSGVVTLDGSEPVTGARVTLIPAGSANRKHTTRRTVTVEGGRFNIGVPAGKYLLRVFKQDVGEREIKVEVKEHETTDVAVAMKDKPKKGDKKDEKKK